MKIIYFGSSSSLSISPLETLIKSHHTLSAIVVKNDLNSDFNVISPNTIESLAYNNSVPVLNYKNQSANLVVQLSDIKPDLIIVSCFSKRIPSSILSLAKLGGINLHPSLLPKYRGPDPIFWQYRDGVGSFGITLHRLTDKLDAGDIILKKEVKLIDGLRVEEATQQLASHAAELMMKVLEKFEKNNIMGIKQNQDFVSYQSFPSKADYTVSTSWTAKRIYNFINAFKSTNVIFLCDVFGTTIRLTNAKSYQSTLYPDMDGKVVLYKNSTVIFACKDGYVECEVKDWR